MTILSAITNVANEAGYTVDPTVIGSTNKTNIQLLAIAHRIIREMRDSYAWPALYASGSITLVAGTPTYALPGAFSQALFDTFWNSTNRYRILGPISEQEYAEIRGYGLTATLYPRMQIRGITNNQLTITPTPGTSYAGDVIIFEYIADRPIRPVTWSASTLFSAGAYCFYNGNYYVTSAGGTTGSTAPTWTTGTQSDGGVNWTYYDGAYSTFLADTDEPVLSQRIMEQGMLERFAEIHKLEGVVPRFSDQLHEEYSKVKDARTLYAGYETRGYFQYGRSGTVVFGSWI